MCFVTVVFLFVRKFVVSSFHFEPWRHVLAMNHVRICIFIILLLLSMFTSYFYIYVLVVVFVLFVQLHLRV